MKEIPPPKLEGVTTWPASHCLGRSSRASLLHYMICIERDDHVMYVVVIRGSLRVSSMVIT